MRLAQGKRRRSQGQRPLSAGNPRWHKREGPTDPKGCRAEAEASPPAGREESAARAATGRADLEPLTHPNSNLDQEEPPPQHFQ